MKEIKFTDVGEGITEGKIVKWLVKDGDSVKEDASVVQVETDKAVVTVPSPIDGTIRIMVKEGGTLHIGDVLAAIGEPGELAKAAGPQQTPAQKPGTRQQPQKTASQAAAMGQAQGQGQGKAQARPVLAAPSVRKMAHERGIDLSAVHGTGPGGRILASDLKAAPAPQPGAGDLRQVQQIQRPQPQGTYQTGKVERIPMSTVRKTIARNMELSWTIPRAVHMDMVNATQLYRIVEKAKPKMLKQFNVKLTFLPFIIKAVIEALKEIPNFNASYDQAESVIIRKLYYNIGIAAETEDGLKIIVVKQADTKSIRQIAQEIHELSAKLRDKTISLDEMRDSTFTITNIGSLGGGFLSVPMINYPEVGILGIHLIRDTPISDNGKIRSAKILPFSVTFDHRVVDGAEAVKFGNAIIRYLEDPDFLEMLG